jgi:tetratricopeptide (TPR) repeat protein
MDNERAIHDFTEAINLNPKLAAAFLNRGYLYYAIKFDSDRALDDLNEAVRLNPEDAEAFDLRAVIYASKNDYENAKKSVGEAKRVNPILMGVKQEVCGGEEFCDAFLREGKKQSFSNYEIYFYAVGGTGYGTVGAVLKKDGKQRSVLKVFKGLGANGEVLEINTKVLDGQNYLEVYEATSKGNGTIELYRLDGSTVLLVFDARGVDQHDDGSMFEGGLLRASYPDINQDGHFDVVLEGTVVSGGDSPDRSLVKQQCRRVFLWNPKTALFQESAGGAINPKLCGEAK